MPSKTKTEKTVKKDNKAVKEIFKVEKPEVNVEELELTDGMEVVLEKYTFRKLLRSIRKGKIIVDRAFQRGEIYRVLQKSGIINSAMLGKSIPPLYAFEDKKNGNYVLSIIDGQQRISAVRDFMDDKYALKIPFGKLTVLNGLTYSDIEKINKNLAEQIGDLTLDINVIRNISKKEAQEYFGLINTTSVPLSPGEKLWSIHEPVKPILEDIVENPYFKITNLRKTRKREYLVATKLLWNYMFLNPLKHEFVGDTVQQFIQYFNTMEDVSLLKEAKKKVLNLLEIYSKVVENCQYSPRTQGDLYSTLCFLSILEAKNQINTDELSQFINWVFKGINKSIYPITLKEQFDVLIGNRITAGKHLNSGFVIQLESLYYDEGKVWKR